MLLFIHHIVDWFTFMVKQFCEKKNSFAIAIKLYRLFFCAVNLITDSRHMG